MKNLSWAQVITHLLTLVVGLGIGYFAWNKPAANVENPTIASKVTPPSSDKEFLTKGEAELPPATNTTTLDSTNSTSPPDVKNEKEEKEVVEPKPVTGENLARVNMGISDKKISEVLTAISKNLEAKKLAYVSSQMQDCSGIFHQLKDSLQSRLPALAGGSEYQYPAPANIRSSRQIADWFYKNDNLLIVQNAVASKNSIRPGSVLFYGKSNKKYSNINIDMLTDRNNNYTPNGAIGHIAVVTEVKTDAEGNVLEYTMMHGRNPRRHASRTGSKEVQSRNTKGLPPFGNWSQQLVAIANIATPK